MKSHHPLIAIALLLPGCGESPTPAVPSQESKAETRPEPKEFTVARRSIVEFKRGKYATPSAPAAPVTFAPDSATEDEKARALIARIKTAVGAQQMQQLMAEAASLESRRLLDVVDELQKHSNPDLRAQALAWIEGYSSSAITPTLIRALSDSSVDVRMQALETAMNLNDPAVQGLALTAMQDTDLNVRQIGLQAGLRQSEEIQAQIIEAAARSPHADLAQAGLALVEASPSKANVHLLMEALDHAKAPVREQAHEVLALTLHRSFANQAAAKAWWSKNQQLFDEKLVILDTDALAASAK
jgi:HEAT repeat protein